MANRFESLDLSASAFSDIMHELDSSPSEIASSSASFSASLESHLCAEQTASERLHAARICNNVYLLEAIISLRKVLRVLIGELFASFGVPRACFKSTRPWIALTNVILRTSGEGGSEKPAAM